MDKIMFDKTKNVIRASYQQQSLYPQTGSPALTTSGNFSPAELGSKLLAKNGLKTVLFSVVAALILGAII